MPIDGDPEYVEALAKLVFGKTEDRICGAQTIGGTGALFVMGRLAKLWTDQIAIFNAQGRAFSQSLLSPRKAGSDMKM